MPSVPLVDKSINSQSISTKRKRSLPPKQQDLSQDETSDNEDSASEFNESSENEESESDYSHDELENESIVISSAEIQESSDSEPEDLATPDYRALSVDQSKKQSQGPTPDGDYPCQFPGCSKVFGKASRLRRHMVTHSGRVFQFFYID